MRRLFTVLATVAILTGLGVSPAAADKPTVMSFSVEVDDFFGLDDPCNEGESLGGYNIVLEAREHVHAKSLVAIVKGSGTTDEGGYVLSGSPEHVTFRWDGSMYIQGFSDTWYSAETGDKFRMTARFVEKDGEVRVDKFRTWCLGNPSVSVVE